MKKRMLLHTCCAPCASGVTWQLEDYDLTLLFYNPNIDTLEEYNRRLDACEKFCKKFNLKLIAIPYNHEEFLEEKETPKVAKDAKFVYL